MQNTSQRPAEASGWLTIGGDLSQPGGVVDTIAKRHQAQPGQVAIAWLLHRSPTVLPIPGTSTVKHLEDNVLGATLKLSQEEFELIDQASRPGQS